MSYSFTIEQQNILNTNSKGDGSVSILPQNYLVPQDIKGLPGNLQILYNMFQPNNNISFGYAVKAKGRVSSHDCWATYTLYTSSRLDDGSYTALTALASTSDSPGSGAGIDSGWVHIYSGPRLIQTVSTREECSGSGCGCRFESKGGWSEIKISLQIKVTVNLKNYCTADINYLHDNDLCYNWISNTYNKKLTQGISDLAKKYCAAKYPNRGLDIFYGDKMDPKDKAICGCNMSDDAYNAFTTALTQNYPNLALGSINPRCIFPACVNSSWQGPALDSCPIPQCFNVVNFNGSSISANDVTINQNSKCTNIAGGTGSNSGTTGTTGGTAGGSGGTGSTTVNDFWNKWWWLILLGILLLVILIGLGIYLGTRKNKTSQVNIGVDPGIEMTQ
jgi:hypothetical protein